MTIAARIKGTSPGGKATEMVITPEGSINAVLQDAVAINLPPATLTRRKLFYEFLRVGGVPAGSRDMHLVSAPPVEFEMKAAVGRVRWVTTMRLIIEGNNFALSASGDFRKWGTVAPGLTNGIELFVEQGGITSTIFLDPVKNLGDLFYYQRSYENFVNSVDAQADFLSVDVEMPQDVALPLGVEDRIVCRINDNMVNADFLKMQVLCNGYQETE